MEWTHILTLLKVIHAASEAGPGFQKWASEAQKELELHWGLPPQQSDEEEPEEDE